MTETETEQSTGPLAHDHLATEPPLTMITVNVQFYNYT